MAETATEMGHPLTWEEYYALVPEPPGLEAAKARVAAFVQHQAQLGRRTVLVTSGGTTVPLEVNMVRFVDNFSAGTRGATAAEYFIDMGYAVVFLHRQFSLQPYARHYTHSKHCFLDLLEETTTTTKNTKEEAKEETQLTIMPEDSAEMKAVLRKYKYAKRQQLLHIETFVTVTDYLFSLKSFCGILASLETNACFFLAAAVSDFFIPPSRIANHKIESGLGGLSLRLDPVPKILLPLVKLWCPNAYTVSFKLETDDNVLIPKARRALRNYGHQLVIANMLHTRKVKIVMVERDSSLTQRHRKNSSAGLTTPSTEAVLSPIDQRAAESGSLTTINLSDQEQSDGVEIESKMVPFVIGKHTEWIASCSE